jgi:hypothetical protein
VPVKGLSRMFVVITYAISASLLARNIKNLGRAR